MLVEIAFRLTNRFAFFKTLLDVFTLNSGSTIGSSELATASAERIEVPAEAAVTANCAREKAAANSAKRTRDVQQDVSP